MRERVLFQLFMNERKNIISTFHEWENGSLYIAAGVLRKGVELTVEKWRKFNFLGIMREILISGEFRKGPKTQMAPKPHV
jgi:hypothetical protein